MKTNFLKIQRAAGFILMFWLAVASHGFGQDFAGIGIALNKENGSFVVKQVLPGGPAASSGKIKVNDRIVAIAQEDKPAVTTEGLELTEVTRMIRGTKGTSLRLIIVPGRGENVEAQRGLSPNISQANCGPLAFHGRDGPQGRPRRVQRRNSVWSARAHCLGARASFRA